MGPACQIQTWLRSLGFVEPLLFVDHSSINRWAIRFLSLLEKVFRKHKRQVEVGGSWRMDETFRDFYNC